MSYDDAVFNRLGPILPLLELFAEGAESLLKNAHQAFRLRGNNRRGATLRPGKDTPLWNQLRIQLRPHLRRRGEQAKLGRQLGLPRQRINAYVTGGGQMPDAERTLQLIAWLLAVRAGTPPK